MKMHKIAYLGIWAAIAGGCSIINAPEELIEVEGDGDGDGDGDTGDGDGDMGGAAGDGDGDGDTGGTPGDGDGDTGGTPGDGDGDLPMVPEEPTTGLIVVAGEDLTEGQRALVVLDASDGSERSRETLPAVSVAYDEAADRLAWFIFTSTRVDPGANTRASLEVRQYLDDTDEWVQISTTAMLPPPLLRGDMGAAAPGVATAPFRPIVLNGRLAYISQIVVDSVPVPALTILDTTDLTSIQVQDSFPVPMGDGVVGLVGRRGTDLDPEADGGALSLMVSNNCSGAGDPICDLVARPFVVGDTIDELSQDRFGAFQGTPAFASTPVLPSSVSRPFKSSISSLGGYALVFDPNVGSARWWQFDPADPASKASPSSLAGSTAQKFIGFAVSECLAAGITGDASEASLLGVHLGNGNALSLMPAFGDTAMDIVVDPFRRNVLSARSPGSNFASVRAFQIETIGPEGGERIALAERAVWNSPDDIDPIALAVRHPVSPNCN